MEKIGIEKLKKALAAVIGLGTTITESLADESISAGEWVKISFSGIKLAAAVKDFKALKIEFKDLDETEKAELIAYVETELDLENDQVEAMIEEAFAVLITFATGFKKAA